MHNKRAYKRSNHLVCDAKIQKKDGTWQKIDVEDLSSGGAKLYTRYECEENQLLEIDIKVNAFFSEFRVKTIAQVRNKTTLKDGGFQYGVVFINMEKNMKIRIDENVHKDRPIAGNDYS